MPLINRGASIESYPMRAPAIAWCFDQTGHGTSELERFGTRSRLIGQRAPRLL
jgi:hypothetical protein